MPKIFLVTLKVNLFSVKQQKLPMNRKIWIVLKVSLITDKTLTKKARTLAPAFCLVVVE
jgi:hypothetical protein